MCMAIHRTTALPTCFVLSSLTVPSGTFTPGLLKTKLPLSQGVIHNTREDRKHFPFPAGMCSVSPPPPSRLLPGLGIAVHPQPLWFSSSTLCNTWTRSKRGSSLSALWASSAASCLIPAVIKGIVSVPLSTYACDMPTVRSVCDDWGLKDLRIKG